MITGVRVLAPPGACTMVDTAGVFGTVGAEYRVFVARVHVEQVLPHKPGQVPFCVARTETGLWGLVPLRWLRPTENA